MELRRKLLPYALAESAPDAALVGGVEHGPHDTHDSHDTHDTHDSPGDDTAQAIHAKLDTLLDWLEANRYLSPQRFVESRVHARAARFGNLRIRQELAQHQLGVPAELESTLRDTELDRARAVWAARFSHRPGGLAERGRQGRFLAGRAKRYQRTSPRRISRARTARTPRR